MRIRVTVQTGTHVEGASPSTLTSVVMDCPHLLTKSLGQARVGVKISFDLLRNTSFSQPRLSKLLAPRYRRRTFDLGTGEQNINTSELKRLCIWSSRRNRPVQNPHPKGLRHCRRGKLSSAFSTKESLRTSRPPPKAYSGNNEKPPRQLARRRFRANAAAR
jgi:hypothetical protein